jgi:hypothetical protein
VPGFLEENLPYKDKEVRKKYLAEYSRRNINEYKKRGHKRRKELHLFLYELKSNSFCEVCGENDPACLHYHHLDSTKKIDGLYKMICRGFTKEKLLEEINKCVVLCANCHKKLHFYGKLVHLKIGDEDEQQSHQPVKLEIAGPAPVISV